MKKNSIKIIQSKIFLFDTATRYKDPKDLVKIEKEMNDWCWDNNIINGDDTMMDIIFGDGYIVGTLHYSKIKTVKV